RRHTRSDRDWSSDVCSSDLGRKGTTLLLPVIFTQFACDAVPVPRLNPIQTLASFVPTIATLAYFGEYFTWLMNERLPSVCLVMFCVVGLFVMYQSPVPMEALPPLIVSHTLVVPAVRWPHPPGTPPAGQSSPPGTP